MKAKFDWFSIVYCTVKNGLKQNEIMTQYLNKLISYLNFYSLPSSVQGTLNGASFGYNLYDLKENLEWKGKVESVSS